MVKKKTISLLENLENFKMFPKHKTRAIILSKEDRGEYDRLLTLYTKEFGKIVLFCKSIRKESSKLRFGAEPMLLIDVEFIEGKSFKTLTDIVIVNSYANIAKDIKKISLAGKIAQDLSDLIKGEEKDWEVWKIIEQSFNNLNNTDNDFITYQYFFWRLIDTLGYGPELYSCVKCGKNVNYNKIPFSLEIGGILCDNCAKTENYFTISVESLKMLRLILAKDFDFLTRVKISHKDEEFLWVASGEYLNSLN
ncbi:MAG TPA: DNA repair protein RecO [Candidatus Pacearchaeota archaeon]|nr:DNA repair protein RecO [Candidatus Pacearchaeota archaeon]